MRAFISVLLIVFCLNSKNLRSKNDSPIIFTIIEENTAKITNYKATPASIVPGESIQMKMQYQATQTVTITKLFLETKNNGVVLFTDTVTIGKTYSEGDKDVTGYSATIPSFCPPGSWDIFLYLKDDSDSNVAILKAHFDIE